MGQRFEPPALENLSDAGDDGTPFVGNWEWDFQSGAVTWSDGLFRLLGLRPGSVEPTYQLFLSMVHPDDRAKTEAVGQSATRQGGTIDYQYRIIRSCGAVRWLASKGEVFIDADRKPAWAAGAIFDITELRQAQQELAAREARYRALSQMNAIGERMGAPDGSVLSCQFWVEFTGQTESVARGLGWLEAVHPEDRDTVVASWGEALRIGSSVELVYRARHRSGAFRWIRSKAIPIRNADGTVREWIGSDEDIHAWREAEENLRVNEKRHRIALSAAKVVTWDYDLLTRYVTRSDNAIEILGSGSGPIEALHKCVHPEDHQRVVNALGAAHATGAVYDVVYRAADASGQVRWLHDRGKLLRNAHKEPDRIIGVTFDITPQKRAEADREKFNETTLKLSARVHALTSLIGGIVWTASPHGKVSDVAAWGELTGQTSDEASGWGWLNAVHPSDRERVRDIMQRLMDTNVGQMADYRVRTRSEGYKWFRSRAATVFGNDGSVIEWIGILEPLQKAFVDSNRTVGGALAGTAGSALIAGYQVRAARAILNWSVRDLAEASGVSSSTIRRIEDDKGIPENRDLSKLQKIREALETAGIEFTPPPDGKVGLKTSNAE
jgi:PAS domain S-box-containing protein